MMLKEASEKFKNWLKDRYNLTLFILLIAFVIFRFYFFFSTLQQPLWWDEAYYMNNARTWAGGLGWKVDSHRPVLFPLILTIFYLLKLNPEFLARLFVLFCSIVSVPLLYGIGNLFFNKKIALISSFILAVFWSFSFYSYRVLVDIPLVALWLATTYLFFNAYFQDKSRKYFVLAGIFLGLTFLMKFSALVLVFLLAFYLLTTEKSKVFANKKIIIFFLSSLIVVLPFFIWQHLIFKSPISFATHVVSTRTLTHTFTQSLIDQAVFAFKLLHSVFLILLVIGLLSILGYTVLLWNKTLEKNSTSNKYYFVFLWLILSLLFFGYMNYEGALDERYYYIYYPALFLFAGNGLSFIYKLLGKYQKQIAFICILAILAFGAYQNITNSNQIIEIKKDSFLPLKQAGLWLKENTNESDMILLIEEPAEISYYSNRNYFYINEETPQTLPEKVKEYKPKYLILSFYYSLGDEKRLNLIKFIFSNKDIFIPIQTYGPYIDEKQTLPLVVIFEVGKIENF